MSQLSDKALSVAITQIGESEKPLGSNWGHPVQDYLASVNINFPASWCMAFVYWCFKQASEELNIINPLAKTAGVLNEYNLDKLNHVTGDPQPGDIFIMDFGGGLGHTGIVEKINDDKSLSTIEGNTNNNGSREGIAVERKLRHNTKPIIGFLRY